MIITQNTIKTIKLKMLFELIYLLFQIFAGSVVIFISIIVSYRLYSWINKTNHDVKHKDSSNVKDGIIYLLDESIDHKFSLVDLITPKTDAFDKPQKICNMIKHVNKDTEIKLVINTSGGSLFSCHKILDKLLNHTSGYIAYIKNESMSAGTIIALGAKEIVMDDDSYLGKIDPQMSVGTNVFASINYYDLETYKDGKYLTSENINIYRHSVESLNYLENELLKKLIKDSSLLESIKKYMVYSKLPHSKKFNFDECKNIGLPVRRPNNDHEKELISV